ncbi:MAG: hypothetical protein H6819_13115 [Phycisphaerales bacterium]|nr:hypothetical protein [Phycisphaerales bacterium]MCB9855769.1 hypothetical protein [Phycisphaerales bacterium]MCB9862664.1 hypothetical protein [Phycisphaerales bacterium]
MIKLTLALMVFASSGVGQTAPGNNSEPSALPKTTTSGETTYRYPNAGDLKVEVADLRAQLEKMPDDDNIRLRLGFVEFLRGFEELAQSLYQFGLREPMGVIPMPITSNSNPKKMTYEDSRRIIENWLASLNRAEETLARIRSDDVAFRVDVADIVIDYDSDGKAAMSERLDGVLNLNISGAQAVLIIRFDRTDAHWLRGYCHLLAGVCEFALAHDWRDFFEHAGQLFFEKIETPYAFLHEQNYGNQVGMIPTQFLDIAAGIHLLRFDVKEPERLKAAHAHFKETIRQSREMWASAMKETDNELEWIPNPRQEGVLPIPMTELMTKDWLRLLDEVDAILDGRKLIPFWREGETRGVNLKRVFMEPRQFDVVLWLQGTAAAAYLEKGEITSADFWNSIQRGFGGQLTWYALWMN